MFITKHQIQSLHDAGKSQSQIMLPSRKRKTRPTTPRGFRGKENAVKKDEDELALEDQQPEHNVEKKFSSPLDS
jgi:hypothetical protein